MGERSNHEHANDEHSNDEEVAVDADRARTVVRESLARIAPEVDFDEVDLDGDLRDVLDLDSMDFLNLVTGIHDRTGLEVPERDYPLLATVGSCISYVAARG
jgi:acyl carrier protein